MQQYPSYSDYKKTDLEWLGDIPKHWKISKAKRIWKQEKRTVRKQDEIVTAFRDGTVTLRKNRRIDGFTNSLKEIGYQGIRKGDLVIHNMDAFAGSIGVSDSDGKSTPVYSVCTPVDDANAHYYKYLLKEMSRSGYIESLAKGIRERSTDFRYNDFAKLEYPQPPLEEQNSIANFILRKTQQIQQFISKKQQHIQLLQEQKAAIINRAVTKGIDSEVALKDSGIEWLGKIPEHWEVKKLKYLTSKVGSGVTPSGGASTYQSKGIPLLRSQNIHFDKIDLENVAYISPSVHKNMSNSRVHADDVLLNVTGGSLGRCYYVDSNLGEANVNQHVCIIRPNRFLKTQFLNLLLSSEIGQHQIWFFQKSSGREGLNFQSIKNFIFPIPSIQLQEEIVSHVQKITSKIDESITKIQRQIELIEEYQQSLIAKAVTGKIDVRRIVN